MVYQDWRLACPKDSDPKASCQLATEFVDQRSGTPLAQLALERLDGKQTMSIRVPLTVLIPALGIILLLVQMTLMAFEFIKIAQVTLNSISVRHGGGLSMSCW